MNKLVLRPHEEKNRLLAHPIVLSPPSSGDQSWADSVAEYLGVSPESFRLDAPDEILELHRLTAGLYRALRELLTQAYREAVNAGRTTARIVDVRRAYASLAYTSNRRDIEDLTSLSVSRAMESQRPDLVSPFVDRSPKAKSIEAPLKVPLSSAAISAALIEGSISASAKSTLAAVNKSAEESTRGNRPAAIIRMQKRGPVSAQSLLDGAELFRQSLQSEGSARKKSPSSKSDLGGKDDLSN